MVKDQVVTATDFEAKSPQNSWAGKAEIVGDIVSSDTTDLWYVAQKD
jgi:hypothetical protein